MAQPVVVALVCSPLVFIPFAPLPPPPLVKLLVAPLEGRVGMRWKETIGKQSLFSKYWIWLNNLSLSHHSVLQVGK